MAAAEPAPEAEDDAYRGYYGRGYGGYYGRLQGDPKGSERFFKNGCGIKMSQATPTKFSLLFKHNNGQLF